MTRHIKLKHGAAARPVKTREVYLDLNNLTIPSIPQTSQFPLFQSKGIEIGSEDGLTKMQNSFKDIRELANTLNSIQTQDELRQSAGFNAQRVKNLMPIIGSYQKLKFEVLVLFFAGAV